MDQEPKAISEQLEQFQSALRTTGGRASEFETRATTQSYKALLNLSDDVFAWLTDIEKFFRSDVDGNSTSPEGSKPAKRETIFGGDFRDATEVSGRLTRAKQHLVKVVREEYDPTVSGKRIVAAIALGTSAVEMIEAAITGQLNGKQTPFSGVAGL